MYWDIACIGSGIMLTKGLWYDAVNRRSHHMNKIKARGLGKKWMHVLPSKRGPHSDGGEPAIKEVPMALCHESVKSSGQYIHINYWLCPN